MANIGDVKWLPKNMAEDSEHRFVTDTEKTSWNSKADSNHTHTLKSLGAASSDHTHTLQSLGAAAASHGTHVTYTTSAPSMDGTASAGSSAEVARADHVHPTDTSRAAVNHTHTIDALGVAPLEHTHTKSQITDFPTTLPNANAITIKLNNGSTEGTNLFTYTGSTAKTINITPSSIGAAASSHGTHVSYGTDSPSMNGTASVGSATTVSRSDHVHPTDTSRAAASHTHERLRISVTKNGSTTDYDYTPGSGKAIDISIDGSAEVAKAVEVPVGEFKYGPADFESSLATTYKGTWTCIGNMALVDDEANKETQVYIYQKTSA
jgi:hypothetical protein